MDLGEGSFPSTAAGFAVVPAEPFIVTFDFNMVVFAMPAHLFVESISNLFCREGIVWCILCQKLLRLFRLQYSATLMIFGIWLPCCAG